MSTHDEQEEVPADEDKGKDDHKEETEEEKFEDHEVPRRCVRILRDTRNVARTLKPQWKIQATRDAEKRDDMYPRMCKQECGRLRTRSPTSKTKSCSA